MTLSPMYDFGDLEVRDYATLLVKMFAATLNLSYTSQMAAKYIKFHLRSPADIQFFAALGTHLNEADFFERVHTRGAWLYVTKK